jgi:DNA-directed RNA polymerase subunit RPC12/RpoP
VATREGANLHAALGMFGFGKVKITCSACGSVFRIDRAEQGTWVQCEGCGSKTTVQDFSGLKFHATISVQQGELPASLADIKWLRAFGVEPIPATSQEAHSLAWEIRNVIEKALGNVFISFPWLEGEKQKQLFASIYKSGYFEEIPLRPDDPWDAVAFNDQLKLKMIRTARMHLTEDDWKTLRVRKFGTKKGCYAWSLVEVAFVCPHCGQKLQVDAEGAGSSLACPTCSRQVVVPAPAPVAPSGNSKKGKSPKTTLQNPPQP